MVTLPQSHLTLLRAVGAIIRPVAYVLAGSLSTSGVKERNVGRWACAVPRALCSEGCCGSQRKVKWLSSNHLPVFPVLLLSALDPPRWACSPASLRSTGIHHLSSISVLGFNTVYKSIGAFLNSSQAGYEFRNCRYSLSLKWSCI